MRARSIRWYWIPPYEAAPPIPCNRRSSGAIPQPEPAADRRALEAAPVAGKALWPARAAAGRAWQPEAQAQPPKLLRPKRQLLPRLLPRRARRPRLLRAVVPAIRNR